MPPKKAPQEVNCGAGSTFFVGRTVHKEFKGFGTFTGRIADFHTKTGYRIEYEDGDSEDVTEDILVRARAAAFLPRVPRRTPASCAAHCCHTERLVPTDCARR